MGGSPDGPRFGDSQPLYIEPQQANEVEHGVSADSDTYADAIRRLVTKPVETLNDIRNNNWKSEDTKACLIGGALGTTLAAMTVKATMVIGINPGLSQIVLVLAFQMLKKSEWCSRFFLWKGLTIDQRNRYLLILQAAGSASSTIVTGVVRGLCTGLIMEKEYKNKWLGKQSGESWMEKEAFTPLFVFQLIMTCVSGAFAGALFTNLNMQKALEDDYPMPEAKASASLIKMYSGAEEAARKGAAALKDEQSDENAPPVDQELREPFVMWSFVLPLVMAILIGVAAAGGLLPSKVKFDIDPFNKTAVEDNLEESWKALINKQPTEEHADGFKAMKVIIAAFVASASLSKIPMYAGDNASLSAGVGALLSLRGTISMLAGALAFGVINAYVPVQFAGDFDATKWTGTFDDLTDNSTVTATEKWSTMSNRVVSMADAWGQTRKDHYKWVGIGAIVVNTLYVVYQLVKSQMQGRGKASDSAGDMRTFSWNKPFNVVAALMAYSSYAVLCFQFSAAVPLKVRFLLFGASVGFDFLLNYIGAVQSLLVGSSISPTSACFLMSGLVLGAIRSMELTSVDFGDTEPEQLAGMEGAARDHKLFGLWLVRLALPISFTNDASQDYATTQLVKENLYVATRQNLIGGLMAAVAVPLMLWLITSSADGGYGDSEGLVTPQADVMKIILTFMKPDNPADTRAAPWKSLGIGVALGVVATLIEIRGRQKPGRYEKEGKVSSIISFVSKGFSCTGFALGIYLGPRSPIGCGLASGAAALATKMMGGGKREPNKEVFLMAVAFIGGSAVSNVLQCFYEVFVVQTMGTPKTPLWGWKAPTAGTQTDNWYHSWKWSTPIRTVNVGMDNLAFTTIALGISALFTFTVIANTMWGHEMEGPTPEQEPEQDSEEWEQEIEDEVAMRMQILEERWGNDAESAGVAVDKDDVDEVRHAVREEMHASRVANRVASRGAAANDRLEFQLSQKAWYKRDRKTDLVKLNRTAKWAAVVPLALSVVLIAATYLLGRQQDLGQHPQIQFSGFDGSTFFSASEGGEEGLVSDATRKDFAKELKKDGKTVTVKAFTDFIHTQKKKIPAPVGPVETKSLESN